MSLRPVRTLITLALCILLLCAKVSAEDHLPQTERSAEKWAPFQLAIAEPVQLFDRDTNIAGLRLSLFYGKNRAVRGFDFGLWNSSESFRGIHAGLVSATRHAYGVQLGLGNGASRRSGVVQIGAFNSAGEDFSGVQIGAVNETTSLVYRPNKVGGLQIGLLNLGIYNSDFMARGETPVMKMTSFTGVEIGAINAKRQVQGLSIGAINAAREVSGVQIGLVNYADKMEGMQFGLLNFIRESSMSFFPLINAHFR